MQRLARLVCRQKRTDIHTVYALITASQAELSVQAICKQLKVPHSGYYDWSGRAPSARCQANAQLLGKIEAFHAASDATYGMPRIRAELAHQGIVASRKRIASLMRTAHI